MLPLPEQSLWKTRLLFGRQAVNYQQLFCLPSGWLHRQLQRSPLFVARSLARKLCVQQFDWHWSSCGQMIYWVALSLSLSPSLTINNRANINAQLFTHNKFLVENKQTRAIEANEENLLQLLIKMSAHPLTPQLRLQFVIWFFLWPCKTFALKWQQRVQREEAAPTLESTTKCSFCCLGWVKWVGWLFGCLAPARK